MPSRIARTQTAVRVAEFLATREGKKHLSTYGWRKGMPVVMTNAEEELTNAMAMVSVHWRPVFLAMVDPKTDRLHMLYLTTPQKVLTVVEAAPARKTSGDFFKEVMAEGSQEFRVAQWDHTAVAFAVPSCEAMEKSQLAQGRYRLPERSGATLRAVNAQNRVLERV